MFVISLIACAMRIDSASLPWGRQVAPRLQLEVRHDREQVRVPGPLPVAVDAALHVAGPREDRGDRVGHRTAGVVVGVHAEAPVVALPDGGDDLLHPVGQHAPVGVAEDDVGGACGEGRLDGAQRVAGIEPVPVEEVLGVDDDAPALPHEVGDGVCDHAQVLLAGGAQGPLDVSDVALGDERDDVGGGVQQRADLHVVVGPGTGLAGRPERGEVGVGELQTPCPPARRTRCPSGSAPGQPPSMTPTRSSSSGAIFILSATVRFMPSCCAPSRRVVS